MATSLVPIYIGLAPDPTNNDASPNGPPTWEPFSILATNDQWHKHILRFGSDNAVAPTLRIEAHGGFRVPKDYASAAVLVIDWTSTLTTGNLAWDFDYRAVAVGEGLDQTTQQEQVTVTDAAPSTALDLERATISLTDANFTIDDQVEFHLARDGAAAADTMAGSGILWDLSFQYTTT